MNRSLSFLPLLICLALILSACSAASPNAVATIPASTATTTNPTVAPTAAMPTASAAPTTANAVTDTPAVTTTTVATAAVTPTAAASPTSAAGSAPVITAANVASLVATPLTLPEWPGRLLWPGQGVPLPAGLSPFPNLLAESQPAQPGQPNLYPIQLDPASFGKPVPLPITGRVLAYAPDLSSAAAAPETGPLTLYSLDGKTLQMLKETAPYGVSYSPDGKMIAVASSGEIAATLYDVASGKLLAKMTGFETAAPVYSVGIVPGNQTIYWLSRATLQFQDIKTGQMGLKLNFQDFITQIAFTPDGTRMLLNVEGKLILYSLPDGKQLAQVTLSQPMTSLAVSPDGKLIAAGYGAGIQIWDAAALAPLATLPGPNTSTANVGFSPDGRYLVSVHENNILQVWKIKD